MWTFRKNVNHCIYCWSKNNCNDKVLGASFHKCLSERSLYNKFSGALIGIRRGRGSLIGDGALIEKACATRGT